MRNRCDFPATIAVYGLLAWLLGATAVAAETPAVSGAFKGNGKTAKLAYVSSQRGMPLSDKPTTVLVFTEKDHSKDKRPQIKAGFGDFGSALVITVFDDGQVVGCEVAHQAHAKSPFSSIGNLKTSDFKIADGRITGKLTTSGEVETFGQTWEVELEFAAQAP